MFVEYILMWKYFFICFFISLLLFMVSFMMIMQLPNVEKVSIYECGFNPFSDSSNSFDVSFYMVAMLFMIFDLEMVFLFPWVILLDMLTSVGFFSMLLFLFMLMVGFFYEWMKGALDWE